MPRLVPCLLLVTLAIGTRSAVADGPPETVATGDGTACTSFLQRLPALLAETALPVPREMAGSLRLRAASTCGPQVQVMFALVHLFENDLQSARQWRFAANFRSSLMGMARPDLWRGEVREGHAALSTVLDRELGGFDRAEPIMTLRAFEAMLAWEGAHPSPFAPPEAHPVEYAGLRASAERARDAHAATMGLP